MRSPEDSTNYTSHRKKGFAETVNRYGDEANDVAHIICIRSIARGLSKEDSDDPDDTSVPSLRAREDVNTKLYTCARLNDCQASVADIQSSTQYSKSLPSWNATATPKPTQHQEHGFISSMA